MTWTFRSDRVSEFVLDSRNFCLEIWSRAFDGVGHLTWSRTFDTDLYGVASDLTWSRNFDIDLQIGQCVGICPALPEFGLEIWSRTFDGVGHLTWSRTFDTDLQIGTRVGHSAGRFRSELEVDIWPGASDLNWSRTFDMDLQIGHGVVI